MRFLAISGSHRENSQSLKIAQWLCEHLESKGEEGDILDLASAGIPFWHEDAWKKGSDLNEFMKPFRSRVSQADALLLIAPEWGGMVPAALKNFLLYIGSPQAAHKPVMIVGVSSGRGGKYPMSELRISGSKNNRMLYIPDHLIVQNCENVMNNADVDGGSDEDQEIKKRAAYSLSVLRAYAKALKAMRDEEGDALISKDFPFGM